MQAAVDPRLAAMVALAWERTLPPGIVAHDRTFEDAGGDSALLMQFFFNLEELCGRQLPMDGFEVDMGPADFAVYLADSLRDDTPPPAPTAPLFLFPGRGADEPRLAHFRRACESVLPMRTLTYPDWQRMVEADFNIDVLAEELAAVIASETLGSSVKLAGYSFGGHVALATARRLLAQGIKVELVAILDANALQLDNFESPHARPAPLHRRLGRFARSAGGADGGEYCAKVVADVLAQPRFAGPLRGARTMKLPEIPRTFRYHLLANLRMALRVRLLRQWHVEQAATAGKIDAPVFLFRSDEFRPDAPDDLGWRRFCADLSVVPVPGSHLGIFDDANLAVLAERFLNVVAPRAAAAGLA